MVGKSVTRVTWAQQIFSTSAIALRGGPVRRRLTSILKSSSPAIVIAEAKLQGWKIVEIGSEWLFFDGAARHRTVLGSHVV